MLDVGARQSRTRVLGGGAPGRRVRPGLVQRIGVIALALAYNAGAAAIELGERPAWLVGSMREGPLKTRLLGCADSQPPRRSLFSIGHRGAPLGYPEHTRESYLAAIAQGAGRVECDVTFTADRQLVCRHDQCDLHTTTDVLSRPALRARCSVSGGAELRCCTSDFTLAEFRSLCGVRPGVEGDGVCGTLMTHAESIALLRAHGVKFVPELKVPRVDMPFDGNYTAERYAQSIIDEYRAAGVPPTDVWLQSFDLNVIRYWADNAPEFAAQAVYLDSRPYRDESFEPSAEDFAALHAAGVRIIAPPMPALLTLDADGRLVPSRYARLARAAGLELVTWTVERSGSLENLAARNPRSFYFRGIAPAIEREGDVYEVLDVLARDVGVTGVFSDWPATTTFYASCMRPG